MAKPCRSKSIRAASKGGALVEVTRISTAPIGFSVAMTEFDERKWFAIFTASRNEQSAWRHLDLNQIESFLPTYESVHVWKNRQARNRLIQSGAVDAFH